MFDPEIFLEIAKGIIKIKDLDLEGRIRTGIGRSYYAAFLKSFLILRGLGESFPDDQRIHSDIRKCLLRRRKSNIASKLNRLFEMRVKADYKLYSRVDRSIYQNSIVLSEDIINKLDSI
jgi:hypothetical protein